MFSFPLSGSFHNTNLIWTITADDDIVIILSVEPSACCDVTKSEKAGKGYKLLENRKIGKGQTRKYAEKKKEDPCRTFH